MFARLSLTHCFLMTGTTAVGYEGNVVPAVGLGLGLNTATGYNDAAVISKEGTCAGYGQNGGPGFCQCLEGFLGPAPWVSCEYNFG